MLNLNAQIIPGHSAAGIRLGQPMVDVLHHTSAQEVEVLPPLTVYRFGAVTVWARDGLVDQIGVFASYTGTLPTGVVGMPLVEVQRRMGPVVEEWDDTLMVEGSDGWCFETGPWMNGWEVAQNLDAQLTEIFVNFCKQGE